MINNSTKNKKKIILIKKRDTISTTTTTTQQKKRKLEYQTSIKKKIIKRDIPRIKKKKENWNLEILEMKREER